MKKYYLTINYLVTLKILGQSVCFKNCFFKCWGNSEILYEFKGIATIKKILILLLLPQVTASSTTVGPFTKPRKNSSRFNSFKDLTKTKIFSWKLNHPIYLPFINISSLEMSFQLISISLFLTPHLLLHLVSWSNALMKMIFSAGPQLGIIKFD